MKTLIATLKDQQLNEIRAAMDSLTVIDSVSLVRHFQEKGTHKVAVQIQSGDTDGKVERALKSNTHIIDVTPELKIS